MPCQHVGTGDVPAMPQRVQVRCDPRTVLRGGSGVAPAAPGQVVDADPGITSHGWCDPAEDRGHLSGAWFQHHGGAGRAGAVQVQVVAPDVDHLPVHGVVARVGRLTNRFVARTHRGNGQHGQHRIQQPKPGAAAQLPSGTSPHPSHQHQQGGRPDPVEHVVHEGVGTDEQNRTGQSHEHRGATPSPRSDWVCPM